jgi:hypothetical protein
MSGSGYLFETLPVTKAKVSSTISKLKDMYNRDPTEDEVATYLGISKEQLKHYIKPIRFETRYYGSSLAQHNRPSGSPFDDPMRYERMAPGASETSDALLYNDEERMRILQQLQLQGNKKIGGKRTTLNRFKKRYNKTSSRRKHSKKYRKSLRRK